METKMLALSLCELKARDDVRAFSGYASVFNGLDSYGDTIAPGAYAKTLQQRDRPIRMRWNHYGPVIGKYTRIEEDEKGLLVEGELTPGHSVAEDVYASLKHEAIDGLSIGFRVKEFEKSDDARILKEIELVEISVVEEPADGAALITDVKHADFLEYIERADSLKEIERLLRDACSLSRSAAKAMISQIKSLHQRDADSKSNGEDAVQKAIKQWSLKQGIAS